MDQLISQVSQRANISPDQAQKAVQATADFLKTRLPQPIASQLDNMIGGQTGPGQSQGQGGYMGQAQDQLGGMFGGQQPRP